MLIEKSHGLHARYFKTFATTHVLAHDHVVATQHVRLGFGKLGAIAIVCAAAGQLLLLGTDQPGKFILASLPAMRTSKVVGLLGFFLVEKIALIHEHTITQKDWVIGNFVIG